jgi:alkylation response protein AidB-like acyl-CoA dehydrogenase
MPQLIMDDEDGVIAMLRESIAAFAESRPGPKTTRSIRAAAGDMDIAQWKEMAEAGWVGLMLPEALGGSGLGIREQAIVSEALGQALVPSPMATASVLASALISGSGASAERTRLAADLVSGEAIVMPAISDEFQTDKLVARSGEGGVILSGRADFVEAAQSATDFLVLAALGGEDLLVSVPAHASGLRKIARPGVDGAAITALVFADLAVASDRILARGNLATMVGNAVDLARLALAAELSGNAGRAFAMASTYTQERVQFGKPIASFQVIQHRLVDLWTEAEFACSAVVNAIERIEDGNAKAARLAILAAKARASDAAFLIGRRAIHLYGAMGFTDECDIGLYLKRAINLGAMFGQAEKLRRQFVSLERAA